MARVTILDCDFGNGEIEREVLEQHGHTLTVSNVTTDREIVDLGREADGLLIQYAPLTAALADELPNLRAVVRYGVGVDNLQVDLLQAKGIAVSGVTDYCTDEVADHCVALMLSALRSIPESSRKTRAGEWPAISAISHLLTLTGKSVGLVGFGRIAQEVARRLSGFRCEVMAYDPYLPEKVFGLAGVKAVGLDDALGAEIVSLHLPLAGETRNIIDAGTISKMRRGVFLVNVSRGGLIDGVALADALDRGHIACLAADVLEPEGPGNSLVFRDDVIITPHVGYYSPDSLARLRRRAAEKMVDFLSRRGS